MWPLAESHDPSAMIMTGCCGPVQEETSFLHGESQRALRGSSSSVRPEFRVKLRMLRVESQQMQRKNREVKHKGLRAITPLPHSVLLDKSRQNQAGRLSMAKWHE